MREDKSLLISYLEQQKMDNSLIYDIVEFREKYDTAEEVQERIYIPDMLFYGKRVTKSEFIRQVKEIIGNDEL